MQGSSSIDMTGRRQALVPTLDAAAPEEMPWIHIKLLQATCVCGNILMGPEPLSMRKSRPIKQKVRDKLFHSHKSELFRERFPCLAFSRYWWALDDYGNVVCWPKDGKWSEDGGGNWWHRLGCPTCDHIIAIMS